MISHLFDFLGSVATFVAHNQNGLTDAGESAGALGAGAAGGSTDGGTGGGGGSDWNDWVRAYVDPDHPMLK